MVSFLRQSVLRKSRLKRRSGPPLASQGSRSRFHWQHGLKPATRFTVAKREAHKEDRFRFLCSRIGPRALGYSKACDTGRASPASASSRDTNLSGSSTWQESVYWRTRVYIDGLSTLLTYSRTDVRRTGIDSSSRRMSMESP
jgi:hypothetical protein